MFSIDFLPERGMPLERAGGERALEIGERGDAEFAKSSLRRLHADARTPSTSISVDG
jgi:hypothetical protein